MEAAELIVDEGHPANAGRFFQLGGDLVALLDELTDTPVAWRITELRSGSAVARLMPPPQASDAGRWLRLAVRSLGIVQAGGGLSNDEWSPDAIKAARRFIDHGQPMDDDEDWAPPRLVLVGDTGEQDHEVMLTARLGRQLGDLQPFERRMPASVRGTLVGLNVSRGNRASLRTPSGRIVRVGFDTSLRADLKEAMLQPVELCGDVRQDGDGRAFHVRAETVQVLVRPSVQWADLFGMDPDFTGASTTEVYLEERRGEA